MFVAPLLHESLPTCENSFESTRQRCSYIVICSLDCNFRNIVELEAARALAEELECCFVVKSISSRSLMSCLKKLIARVSSCITSGDALKVCKNDIITSPGYHLIDITLLGANFLRNESRMKSYWQSISASARFPLFLNQTHTT